MSPKTDVESLARGDLSLEPGRSAKLTVTTSADDSCVANTDATNTSETSATTSTTGNVGNSILSKRRAVWEELRKRKQDGIAQNKHDVYVEFQRSQIDHKLEAQLSRKRAQAAEKLDQLDIDEQGQDYARRRAWDWTIEESERWDQKKSEKRKARQESGFTDYAQSAVKSYEGKMRKFTPNLESYEKSKKLGITGGDVIQNQAKPPAAAVDRLVADIAKQNTVRRKEKRERVDEEEIDVTYINERNKRFNDKLDRYFSPYTRELSENLERGTAL